MACIFGHCDNRHTMLSNDRTVLAADHADPTDPGLAGILRRAIEAAGGWIGFDEFMALALYAPGCGYYAHGSAKFGRLPADATPGGGEGSDFVTAPEMTPLFGQTLAEQVAQALQATGTTEVWEFGAGTGALALQLLDEFKRLQVPIGCYTIVDLSGSLRARQKERLQAHAGTVQWVDALPPDIQGVVVGNEVLDAMPVKLLARVKGEWHERGVAQASDPDPDADVPGGFVLAWADRPTALRPPVEVPGPHDYLTEIHPQGEAFMRTLADRLTRKVRPS
jgi:SAM-dependent MidA family methyltransferase